MGQTSSGVRPLIRLPEPWKTTYEISISAGTESVPLFSLALAQNQLSGSRLPPESLHLGALKFSDLESEQNVFTPQVGDNSFQARYHRSLISHVSWETPEAPTAGQIWNLVYAIVTMHPEIEDFRLDLAGHGAVELSEALQATGLASRQPKIISTGRSVQPMSTRPEAWITRSSFWQGAGSPFGSRPVWVANPDLFGHLSKTLISVPAFPCEYTVTFSLEGRPVHAQHPVRPPKPAHGAVIYSRYIPHLDEFFSMVRLDWKNEIHLQLFHDWQNDPRVAAGWNETGTLEQHREYLRKIDEDPHQMSILAKFNDYYFAYFEIYWAKEDHMGVYLSPQAGDWDRGRHSLVGDIRFRGPHRASTWWSSLIHYLFLDDPRTMTVVGEPKYTSGNVLGYDMDNGFHIQKLADLPHKRSAIVRCERIRFFQVAKFGFQSTETQITNGRGNETDVSNNPQALVKVTALSAKL